MVKGATIWGRYPLFEARFTYLEVRVGNQSVEGSGGEERLCENQVYNYLPLISVDSWQLL